MINLKDKWLKTILINMVKIIKLIIKILKSTLTNNLHYKWHSKKQFRVTKDKTNSINFKEHRIKIYKHLSMHEMVTQLATIIYHQTKDQQIRYCKRNDYRVFLDLMSSEQRIYQTTTFCHQIIWQHKWLKNHIGKVKKES